jgi:kynurenine formamidase
MSHRIIQALGRNAFKTLPTFSIVQKRFAATVLQKPKIVDLSRELYHRCLNHPFHVPFVSPSTHTVPKLLLSITTHNSQAFTSQIQTPWDTHQPKVAGNATLRSASYALTMSDHAGTHVDAFKHFGPGGTPIDEMPLEDFYTSAIALDLSHVELKASISVAEMEEALKESGEEIREGDTVLVYMAFNKRVGFDEPRWQHDFPGLHPDAVRWLADRGCGMFGVYSRWLLLLCLILKLI